MNPLNSGKIPFTFISLILSVACATSALGAAPGYGSVCAVVVEVAGQGPSCPVDSGWLVLLGNGNTVLTHGPDPAPSGSDEAPASQDPILYGPYATTLPPPCPTGGFNMRVIYARPANLPDRFTTMAPIVRTLVQMANGLLNEEAQSVGGAALYQVRCDTSLPNFPANGFVAVDHVVLPTNSNADSFSTIVTDLQRLGFSSFFEKYWIYYDDHVGDFGGQGSFHDDDRLVIDNANNHGPDYAITYGYESMQIMMHENAHTLGAVQASAPHSSGAAHCNDGQDIMCYADGGPKSNYNPGVCLVNDAVGLVRQNFDCGHNDYFHPNPPAGSYLATHWNLGSGLNRFIAASKFPN